MKLSFQFLVLFMLLGFCAHLGAVDLIERPKEGRQYETLRFRFVENLKFENPFDLETNQVELLIQQPDFARRTLSFFYNGVNAAGVEQWEARFAPKQAGLHRFTVVINGKAQEQFELPVEANPGKQQGGLKVSARFGIFEYESGEAFRGIGLNVCWANDYEYYFKKMQAAGMNVTRIWICPWNLSFEWQETGLGRYNLESARQLDAILELADKYGIFVILCMDYHGIARKGLGFFRENRWLANPYNKINGGPCVEGADLFTNAEAKTFFKRKYKYLVSRFGHSSRLAAWEFYNEADLMAGKAMPVNRWHIEMAEYIQAIDIHERMVSSSATRTYPEKLVDAFKSPAMDFVMFHDYNSVNLAPHFTDLHEAVIEYYQKPFVLGEFGVEFRGADRTFKVDSQHVGLHNGLWSGWFNETPIIPLSWWWDNYIDPHNLWGEYASLSRFAQAMDFNAKHVVFKTLTVGHLDAKPEEQAPCLVRSIYSGENCAPWLKNMDYQWSIMSEGKEPMPIGTFSQIIPDLAPGRYAIAWYDPQTGKFFEKTTKVEVKTDGVLSLVVPSFSKDLACLVKRQQ
ncbi:glycoside hydrolase family 5 protein [candidate division KSB1 bacterium]|nr:glycoside hydrolase family 5 protein [candidate division KSB1 bacterium]